MVKLKHLVKFTFEEAPELVCVNPLSMLSKTRE